MNWLDKLSQFWPHLLAGFHVCSAVLCSIHALLHKRDTRAVTLWIAVVWMIPIFGPILYLSLGINRIRRRAILLGVHKTFVRPVGNKFDEQLYERAGSLQMMARIVSRVTGRPLLPGNKIEPLINGDEAFPAMLAAIESATKSVSLMTYIFDNDTSGRQFADALARAVERGVAVRVLIDAAGTRYTFPPITWGLRRKGVRYAKFLPASLFQPWRVATLNLRNHRKALVVDGRVAFTGGMNIRQGNVLKTATKGQVQDLHFRVDGPLVMQLQEAFANDWAFVTREVLNSEIWFPESSGCGGVLGRVILDGPDGDFEKLRWTLLAALKEAQTSVRIVTPYFIPDETLITALNLAALRGVKVDIILPEQNNLPYVNWGSRAMWWQVLQRGCHIWLTRPPFDHSKLMIVDGLWVLCGSANWDSRSLRLNFELNIECYDRDFANKMEAVVQRKLIGAREISLAEADSRSFFVKIRDAAARLFAPYL
jgi:cardiolipin synthase